MSTNKYTQKPQKKKQTSIQSMSLEEKLHVLANIIVDRILEEQGRGTLNIFSKK